jgi:putative ABC transport system substrate-binding protein
LRLTGSVVAAIAVLATAACTSSSSKKEGGSNAAGGTSALHIGVIQIASATVLDDTVAAFKKSLAAQLAPRRVSFDVKNAQGDQSLIASIARNFAESDDDAYAAIGTPAVVALAEQVRSKPIFAIAMGDPVGSKVARTLAHPGGNVTGSTDYVDPALLLKQIMTIAPAPKRIGTIYDPSNQNMRVWVAALRTASKASGVRVVESTISGAGDIAAAARSLTGRVDIELIGPDATVFAGLPIIGSTARANKLPVYVIGGDVTTPGIFASLGPNYPTVGALAASAAARVLRGTPAGDVPFGAPKGIEFTVNKQTMAGLGITLPAAIAKTATVQ